MTPHDPSSSDTRQLQTAILFVDLVSTSEFASVLSLDDYAAYVDSFEATCLEQVRHFFDHVHGGKYRRPEHYHVTFLGDEMAVFLHTGKPANDAYQLICLAIALKCGWLGSPLNVERLSDGRSTVDLAAGIHVGPVRATTRDGQPVMRGFAINLAKRIESASREGERFRIFVSDTTFKLVARKVRNLLFGPRRIVPMKGVVLPVAVREVCDSFVDPYSRLSPRLAEGFHGVARRALASNTFDLWIHSCLQVSEGARQKCVTDEALDLCEQVLNIDPHNPVALYYAAEGGRDRGDLQMALLHLQDL